MNYARRLDRRTALRNKRRSVVKDQLRKSLLAERLEERSLLAGDVVSFHSDYWNVANPTDVNADGFVAPSDALAVINRLNSVGSYQLPQGAGPGAGGEGESAPLFIDVNNDGFLSPMDALAVINELNGEGQGPDPKVSYVLQALDTSGNPISSIGQNQQFFLQMTAQDLRPELFNRTGDNPENIRGVYAAYLDVLYDKSLATVAVSETQTITVPSGLNATATLTFTPGGTTVPILFNQTTSGGRTQTAIDIAAAINGVLGPGSATVSAQGLTAYRVIYGGKLNTDVPEPTSSNPGITTAETVSTDPADASYAAAFSNAIVFGAYQDGKSGGDAADRIDELGALFSGSSSVGAGRDPVEVLRIRMITNPLPQGTPSATEVFTPSFGTTEDATHPGPPTGTAVPAPDGLVRPGHDTLVFGNLDAIPVEQSDVAENEIVSTPATLLITSGPVKADSFTAPAVNEGATATIDVITGHTSLNAGATGTIVLKSVQGQNPAGSGTLTSNGNNAIFTPTDPNFNGTVTFTYTAGLSTDTDPTKFATATVTLPITAINDAPLVAVPGTQTTTEDTVKAIAGISVTDVDANDATTNPGVKVTLTATNGTITLTTLAGLDFTGGAGDGTDDATMTFTGLTGAVNTALASLSYKPNADFAGGGSLVISVDDQGNTGQGTTPVANATIAINVSAVNDAPENRLNGTPIDGSTPDQITTPGVALEFSAANSNQITVFDIDAGANPLSVKLKLGAAAQGTLHVTLPTAGVSVTAGANDTASMTLSGGQLAINTALAGLVYTPDAAFTGTATMTITSNDAGATGGGGVGNTISTVTIKLDPGVRPFAVNDKTSIPEANTAAPSGTVIDVLANDFKESGGSTTVVGVTQPAAGQGTVTFTTTNVTYTPPANSADFFTPGAPVTFTYTIHDTVAGSVDSTGTVSVTITNVADTPIATNDAYATTIGNQLAVTDVNEGVLKRGTDDSSVDNDFGVANYAVLTVLNPNTRPTTNGGSVTIAADGTFSYTPNPTFLGDDTFTYVTRSTTLEGTTVVTKDSAAATVTIHVASPPIATNDHFDVLEQGNPATSGNVLTGANSTPTSGPDTDPTENRIPLTAVLVANINPALNAGSVTLNADGTFTYNPPAGENFNTDREPKPDLTFTYQAKATDDRLSNIATVSLTVKEVNDNPTANDDAFLAVKRGATGTIGVDQPVAVLTGPGADSIAPDVGETLTVTGIGLTAGGEFGVGPTATTGGGSVRLSGGQILYTSPTTAPGTDTFFYQISDGRGGTDVAQVNVTVVDFVPKDVRGTVYLDTGNGITIVNNTDPSANNGQLDAGEKLLSGVVIHLTGTSFDSQTTGNINFTVTTDVNGDFEFPDMKPPKAGTSYTLTQEQPLFLLDGIDTYADPTPNTDSVTNLPVVFVTNSPVVNNREDAFLLTWSVTDTSDDVTDLLLGELGIDTRSQSQGGSLLDTSGIKQEYLASSGDNGYIFYLDTLGNMLWSWKMDPTGSAWNGGGSIGANIINDGSLLTFTQGGSTVTLGLNYTIPGSTARFRYLGIGPNGQYIIRVDGSHHGSTVEQPFDGMFAHATVQGGEGEGEAAASREYAESADAVFSESAWA